MLLFIAVVNNGILGNPSVEDSINWLKNQINAEINDILTALRVNYNRPLATLNMLQQNLLYKRKIFLRYFWLFYTPSRRSPLEILPYFNKENIFQPNLIDNQFFSRWIKN